MNHHDPHQDPPICLLFLILIVYMAFVAICAASVIGGAVYLWRLL
jgi:hypothetical protein